MTATINALITDTEWHLDVLEQHAVRALFSPIIAVTAPIFASQVRTQEVPN